MEFSSRMSIKSIILLLVSLYVLLLVSVDPALSLPAAEQKVEDELKDPKERATWLETRNLNVEENFEKMVFIALQELASQGLVDPRVVAEKAPEKRGRHQGFCFKKTKTGRFLPYICWKGDNEEE